MPRRVRKSSSKALTRSGLQEDVRAFGGHHTKRNLLSFGVTNSQIDNSIWLLFLLTAVCYAPAALLTILTPRRESTCPIRYSARRLPIHQIRRRSPQIQ